MQTLIIAPNLTNSRNSTPRPTLAEKKKLLQQEKLLLEKAKKQSDKKALGQNDTGLKVSNTEQTTNQNNDSEFSIKSDESAEHLDDTLLSNISCDTIVENTSFTKYSSPSRYSVLNDSEMEEKVAYQEIQQTQNQDNATGSAAIQQKQKKEVNTAKNHEMENSSPGRGKKGGNTSLRKKITRGQQDTRGSNHLTKQLKNRPTFQEFHSNMPYIYIYKGEISELTNIIKNDIASENFILKNLTNEKIVLHVTTLEVLKNALKSLKENKIEFFKRTPREEKVQSINLKGMANDFSEIEIF